MPNFKVIIDTDPGLGKRAADVSDALALFIMFNNPDLFDIIGITTVYGNTPVEIGYKLLRKYLEIANRTEIPYFLGASSKYNLGSLTKASKFLIDKIQEYENELILLALGPLTNISTIFQEFPPLIEKVKQIIFLGGTINPTSAFSPPFIFEDGLSETVEYNFQNDPEAAKILMDFETSILRIGMGLDICCQAVFREEHLNILQGTQNQKTKFLAANLESWLHVWKFNKSEGFYPFDTFVPIYLMSPDLFSTREYYLTVDTLKSPGKIEILTEKRKNSRSITYCMNFRSLKCNKEFMQILVSNLIK